MHPVRAGGSTMLGLVFAVSCDSGPSPVPPGVPPTRVFMAITDMRSSVDAADDLVRAHGLPREEASIALACATYLPLAVIERVAETMRLIRIGDQTEISGEARVGWYTPDGVLIPEANSGAISFVPAAPLEPGWHILVADIRAILDAEPLAEVSGPRSGSTVYARFRVDSTPRWVFTDAEIVGDRALIGGWLSEERTSAGSWPGVVEVSYDGLLVSDCEAGFSEAGFEVLCAPPSAGSTVRIVLDSETVPGPSGARPVSQEFQWIDPPMRGILVEPELGLLAAGLAP